jgi:tRNA 2-thiouridine synthesizing protein A
MRYDEDLDALGLLCPLPVLKARKRLKAMAGGAVLRLRTTDPAALIDVPHFCDEAGHRLLATEEAEGATAYFIEKNGAAQSPKPE